MALFLGTGPSWMLLASKDPQKQLEEPGVSARSLPGTTRAFSFQRPPLQLQGHLLCHGIYFIQVEVSQEVELLMANTHRGRYPLGPVPIVAGTHHD